VGQRCAATRPRVALGIPPDRVGDRPRAEPGTGPYRAGYLYDLSLIGRRQPPTIQHMLANKYVQSPLERLNTI
jgi:hypothetical protein